MKTLNLRVVNKMKFAMVALVVGVMLFGCTQPAPQPTATPVPEPYTQVGIGSYSAEVPTEWSRQVETREMDAFFLNPTTRNTLVFSTLLMEEGDELESFGQRQIIDLDGKLSITEMAIYFAENLLINRFNNRDWFVSCYSFKDNAGKEIGQCQSITKCGSKAGVVALSAEKGKLEADFENYQHALETYSC